MSFVKKFILDKARPWLQTYLKDYDDKLISFDGINEFSLNNIFLNVDAIHNLIGPLPIIIQAICIERLSIQFDWTNFICLPLCIKIGMFAIC